MKCCATLWPMHKSKNASVRRALDFLESRTLRNHGIYKANVDGVPRVRSLWLVPSFSFFPRCKQCSPLFFVVINTAVFRAFQVTSLISLVPLQFVFKVLFDRSTRRFEIVQRYQIFKFVKSICAMISRDSVARSISVASFVAFKVTVVVQ